MTQPKEIFNKVVDTLSVCREAYLAMSHAVKRTIKNNGKVEIYFTDTKGKPISGQLCDSRNVYCAYRYLVDTLNDKKHGIMKLRVIEQ